MYSLDYKKMFVGKTLPYGVKLIRINICVIPGHNGAVDRIYALR